MNTIKPLSRSLVVVLGVACLLAAGCGKSAGEKTYPVTGVVTYNGTPVEGAVVTFAPTGGGQGAVGTTDASGKYSLTTRKKDDGALPGEYLVTIVKYDRPPTQSGGQASAQGGDEYPPDYAEQEYQQARQVIPSQPKNLLPAKYANPQTSGLKATVTTSGPNNFDFALTD